MTWCDGIWKKKEYVKQRARQRKSRKSVRGKRKLVFLKMTPTRRRFFPPTERRRPPVSSASPPASTFFPEPEIREERAVNPPDRSHIKPNFRAFLFIADTRWATVRDSSSLISLVFVSSHIHCVLRLIGNLPSNLTFTRSKNAPKSTSHFIANYHKSNF